MKRASVFLGRGSWRTSKLEYFPTWHASNVVREISVGTYVPITNLVGMMYGQPAQRFSVTVMIVMYDIYIYVQSDGVMMVIL